MIEEPGFSGGTGGTKSCDLAKSAIHFSTLFTHHEFTNFQFQSKSENQNAWNDAINIVVLNRQVESHEQKRFIVGCHSGRQTDRKVVPQHGTHVCTMHTVHPRTTLYAPIKSSPCLDNISVATPNTFF